MGALYNQVRMGSDTTSLVLMDFEIILFGI